MSSSKPADSQDDGVEGVEEGSNCLLISVGSFVSGGVLGGLVGMVGGVFKRQGFKAALAEGATSAKTFALMSGVHSLVTCGMIKLRKTDDVINQGVAGCASGIALGLGGPPSTMLINCAGFAGFAFIYEMLMAKSALATTLTPNTALTRPGSRRQSAAKRQGEGCQLPLCRGMKLGEVLSLGIPCWLLQDRGCALAPRS